MNVFSGIKEIYQRLFKAYTPTFFKRIIYICLTFLAAPEVLIWVTEAINQPELIPGFIKSEWLERLRVACIGAALVAKLAVHWGKTDLKDIPDVKPPVDVIVNNANIIND